MLKATDLPGVPEDLALAVIAHAVTVAPCLDQLPDEGAGGDAAEYRKRALGVLRRVAADAKPRGGANVSSQRVGSAGVSYSVASLFSEDDRQALVGVCSSLCGGRSGGMPSGVFPLAGVVAGLWPERFEGGVR